MPADKSTLDELRIARPTVPRKGRSGLWFVVVLMGTLAPGAAWWFTRRQPPTVRTVAVQETANRGVAGQTTLLNASGYVTPRREATVSSKVTGKVVEVLVEEGSRVEEGQVLARLDDRNVQASLRLAESQRAAAYADLEETRVNLEEAEREWKRVSDLARSQIAAQADLDRADADVRSLRARLAKQTADVAVADREVAVWNQQLEDTIVRAPFAGVVTAKNAQPGEMISPMSSGGFTRTGICTIVDMSSLEIEVDVSESYINRVEPGQRMVATLDAYPDWRIPGKVIAIIPSADRQKATVKVRVGFDQLDPRILPEMGVKVAFQGEPAAATSAAREVWIPKAAVQQDGGRDMVWLVRDGRVERRAIGTGAVRDDSIAVTAGLKPGESVVVESPVRLSEGMTVLEQRP